MGLLPPILIELKASSQELHAKLGDAQKELDNLATAGATKGEKFKAGLTSAFQGAGAAMGALGGVLTAEGIKGTEATVKLQTAVKNAGGAFEELEPKIHKTVGAMADFGHSQSDTETALARLTDATGDPKKALDQMGLVADIAARKHISLADAANLVGKIDVGKGAKALTEFGIVASKTADLTKKLESATKEHEAAVESQSKAQEKLHDLMERLAGKTKLTVTETQALRHAHEDVDDATKKVTDSSVKLTAIQGLMAGATDSVATNLDKLHKKVMGEAAAQADTLGGKFASLKAHMENFAEAAGQKVGPAIAVAGPLLMGMGSILESNLIPNIAKAVVGAVTWSATTIASAVAAAASWVASMVAMAASSVAAWAAILAPFLPVIAAVAAVGAAAYLLWRNWDTVWGFIKAVTAAAFDWIKNHLVWISAAFGPITLVAYEFAHHWSDIWGGVRTIVQDVWDFLKRAFGDIVGIFRSAIDEINHLPGVGLLKDVLGGGASVLHTLHVPGFADGGTVPGPLGAPMLAVVHGGETVTPAGAVGVSMGGVTININGGDPQATARAVRDEILRMTRSNVNAGLA